jgi:hypothetical protein
MPLGRDDPQQIAIPCCFMRGGSSRGGFFLDADLPADPDERAAVLLACYGSPDPRQIDGIGGADPLTSKAAVVARSSRPDADVEYTFYQVGVDQPKVSTGGSCGNMLAGVGPFALLHGLVPAQEPETKIRIYTTNTRQVVTARVPVSAGFPAWDGACAIAGVPDTGAAIRLDFGDCGGAVSGTLLPTGNAQDRVELGDRVVPVSLVDAATPFVFVPAEALGARGAETPEELVGDPDLMARLEAVRGWAAVRLGLVDEPSRARAVTPNIPRVVMVSRPQPYRTVAGDKVEPADMDLCVRQLAMQRPHKALAVTGAVCTAVAAALPGTVVADCIGTRQAPLRAGHPSGVLNIAARVCTEADGTVRIESAEVERTARLIMTGTLYARRSKINALLGQLRGRQ